MTNPSTIILATITDRCDFGKTIAREAFQSRRDAEEWAADQCERALADAEDPDVCDPVAEYADIWFTPMSAAERQRERQREEARNARAWETLDEARD